MLYLSKTKPVRLHMKDDVRFMMRALELARRGEGLTRPNPPVGAVLVQDGEVLAEGWHEKAGGPHAEVACLSRVKGQAADLKTAVLYVTLEPCSTAGKTPPCTELILERGIGRVVVSLKDPNPKHAGRGIELLREAGIDTLCGICETEGRELLAPFARFITSGTPYVTLKLASTLDGRIADRTGDSKWITGEAARERVQAMRRRADAVMVGAGTVRADNPSLLPRPDDGRKPWRVIVGDDLPASSTIFHDEAADRTLCYNGNLAAMMRDLAEEHDVMHVLCEGGGKLAASLIDAELVDEFAFFIAPKLMGADGRPAFAKSGGLIGDMKHLEFKSVEQIGDDLLLRAKVRRKE